MRWHITSPQHAESDDGRFMVNTQGPVEWSGAEGLGVLAWARVPGGDRSSPWGVIGVYPTLADAQAACEAFAQ